MAHTALLVRVDYKISASKSEHPRAELSICAARYRNARISAKECWITTIIVYASHSN